MPKVPALSDGFRPDRRGWGLALAVSAAVVLLPGCAAFRQIGVEVATFGAWPDQRPPGRYAFDRLPSQSAGSPEQVHLEEAAAQALQQVGFTAATTPGQADVLVQLGWSRSRVLSPFADSAPWGGSGLLDAPPRPDRRAHAAVGVGIGVGIGVRRGGIGIGGTFGEPATYDRQQVQMLFIDRGRREHLVEIRVRHEARYSSADYLPLLFDAGLSGFPDLKAGIRQVTVQLP
ncbi:hypothetical protein [Sphaerotilus sp.]|uniref:hypothetical protein n=1 Tax=Sphaerotilus sp. TaxID=2093942 RepID=UPI002ACE028B|nr:hypothetical protein [Sphaerotilus sp.]MDZ7858881.1 hypothetical protein [Sphaerotilus sp.]